MSVEIHTSNRCAVIDIVTVNGRFTARFYTHQEINLDYIREQAHELARILNCEVKEQIG